LRQHKAGRDGEHDYEQVAFAITDRTEEPANLVSEESTDGVAHA